MDALSDVLRVLRLTGGIFLDARFTAPWSLVTNVQPDKLKLFLAPATRIIGFHYVVSGRLVGNVSGGLATDLKAGDLILLPHNDLHVLGSASGLKPASVDDIVMTDSGAGIWHLNYGGGGEETRIICGFLGTDSAFDTLISALPPMLTMKLLDTPGGSWIAESFGFAAQHLASGATASRELVARLSELMFVEAVRHHIESMPDDEKGWFAALRDPSVGKALALMHANPNYGWSSDGLAQAVNMSRSSFADRFSKLIGQPPKRYLTAWRMQIAAQQLRTTPKAIAQIAFDIGYESEAAFTRAFRRELGQPPAAWRKQHTQKESNEHFG